MTIEAILTRTGQATIPKEIRRRLRMKTGDRMTFTVLPNVLMRVKNKSAMGLAGRLFKKGRKRVPVKDLSC